MADPHHVCADVDQSTLKTECLITYITRVWPLHTMYALMYYQSTIVGMLYYIYHKNMAALHYVC